ncbi:MAG: stage II sporulation protein M [Bryobacteraceae bacterium]
MIVDLQRFVETGRPQWQELERELARMENGETAEMSVAEMQHFHELYERACSDLARMAPLSVEPELKQYLEWLVGRAYCEIHESRGGRTFSFRKWFLETFPQTFRRHWRAFQLALALTAVGAAFGALALAIDKEAKRVIMPFDHLQGSPKERVAEEHASKGKDLSGKKTRFSAYLMTHNIQVSLMTLALGMTFGLGTILMIFYNGVILGAVIFDYVAAGEGVFLTGWLLPHGSVEIPAILLAGQAGFVLGHALIGWGKRQSRTERMKAVAPDIVTLAGGVGVLLVWAGIVEAFFSQYHEPVVPYAVKIAFGCVQLALLCAFLARAGRSEAR